MQTTPNLGLKKYETNDTADLTAIGPNWDTLDQEVVKRIVNAGGAPSIQAGPDASKPTPGTAGRLYVATDMQIIYRDTGSAWQKVGVVKWDDIEGKPSSFTPSAHKTTHAIGGSDALSPGDIGAETPAGAQAKADEAAGAVQSALNSHKAAAAPHSGHETPAGAQAKAYAAETNAKNHANSLVGTLSNLLTTAKNNVVAAINEIFGKVEDVEGDLETHKAEITTEEGRHGLRYWNDKLEFFDGLDWIEIETGGGGVPPSNVINPSIIVGDSQLTIKWDDPEDTVVDGQLISTWAGTKLVRKAGSFPVDEKDGVVLVDNKVRGAYASTGFVDSGLTNGTTYYYQLFPYNDLGAVNKNTANRLSGTPQPYKIYGVAIDLTNSNPETAVTYTDDAVGMTGGSSAWDSMAIFKDIKPCVLKNGVVQYYLNPNDFTKKADGSAADITSGNDGDVMIEIPKTGFLILTVGNILTVKVTDDPNNPNFKYYAHSRATEGDRSKLYIGAYLGWKDGSNKLRSLSGKTPTADQTIGTFRTQAKANGSGYDLVSFYPLTLLQCLYLIRYKNLDSQTALGMGYVDGNSAATNTGGTNAKGMFFGETTGKQQMKFLGIEDFWGNLRWWIDGLYSDDNRNIKTAFQNFNDTGSGYTDRGQGATSDISGYVSKPQGFTEAGFVLKEKDGSETTYFCDFANLYASRLPGFGGIWTDGSGAGAFCLRVDYFPLDSNPSLGSRLMYL